VAGFVKIKIRDYRQSYQCRGLVDRIRCKPKTRALSLLKSFRLGIIEDCYVAPPFRGQGNRRSVGFKCSEVVPNKRIKSY
jgi:hypothetical protein